MKINSIIISWMICLATPAIAPQALGFGVQAQNTAVVTGTVLDETGEPIIGATVRVKGKESIGTITDIDGRFSINPKGGKELEVSYIGYTPVTVAIGSQRDLTINLQPSSQLLNEVVLVGYGTQKKESLTGAISQIKGDEVYKARGTTNTAAALQGEIAGLTVTRSSSRPGSEGTAMQVRGSYSINGGGPLILIDGQAASLDELNQMDGSDIENISVLKDASAAIYGSRSAGGVILVTTKRGKSGKPVINYTGSYSTTVDGIKPPFASNAQWLDMFYEAQYQDVIASNPGISDPDEIHSKINWWIFNSFGGPSMIQNSQTGAWEVDPNGQVYKGEALFNALRDGQVLTLQNGKNVERWNPSTLLTDEMFGNGHAWKHNASISGGSDQFNYRFALNYSDAQSQLKAAEDGEKKYGFRLNADYKPNDFFRIETGVGYDIRKITTPKQMQGNKPWTQDMWFWPIVNENGDAYDTFGFNNPYAYITQGGQNRAKWNTFRANGKIVLDFSQWVKGLSLQGTGNFKKVELDGDYMQTPVYMYDWVGTQTAAKNPTATFASENKQWESYTLGGFINYDNTFGNNKVYAMVGMTAENEDYKRIYGARTNGQNYPGSSLGDLNVFNGDGGKTTADGGRNSWSVVSYVGDFRYEYASRYLLSFLFRRDGASRLVPEQRWKNFFSVSGGWIFTNEKFFQNLGIDQWMNFGKIRYNYGKTGSINGIGLYEAYSTIGQGSYYFGGGSNQTTMWVSGMTSTDLTWETINSHDMGIDLGFLNNRLTASFDYFIKENQGMFINVVYPSILGASAPKTNNGKLRTRGWEVEVKWRDRIGVVNYNLGFQVSDAWTKLKELTNNENVPQPGINTNRLIDKPLKAIYVYQTDGIFQTQEEVDAYYEMYYWNADHSGPKPGNVLPAPAETGTGRLRPGARKRVDVNGDGAITVDDIYYAGDAAPRLSFGIRGGLQWKGIDFSFFFQGVGKQSTLRADNFAWPWRANYTAQNSSFYGKTWSPENPDARFTVASRDNNFNKFNNENTDFLLQDNKYIRLKNLVVGYTLPQVWTRRACIEKVRVYFSGDDLWEWSKIKDGFDPEKGASSNDLFPFSRLLNFGVELTF